jgi:hypothetical protein
MIFWKEAWLKPITSAGQTASVDSDSAFASFGTTAGCSEAVVRTQAQPLSTPEGEPIYRCQATELRKATDALPWWDLTQYIEDYTSGNITLREMVESGIHSAWYHLSAAGIGLGSAMRWFYDKFQTLRGGVPFPWRRGVIPRGQRTPSVKLELRPGEWARVKSYHEILNTLDQNNKNRGLYFGCEEVPFCGGTYQVLSRVERIIDEKTGQMRVLKEPGIILDGVYCRAHYCEKRKFCPRAIFTYWREVWLEKTDSPPVPQEKRSIT